ncbi:MAG: transposase, partial [Saprospiraceae bacterium]
SDQYIYQMNFEPETIYHIYNQGNNKQTIFFNDENYLFFLKKMRKYLLPHCEVLAYCLMPNHFHWLVWVKEAESISPKRSLNEDIGTMLSSYTRAINKRENRSGSLFRPKTKAKPFIINEFMTVDHKDWNKLDYANYCFQYIHQNPVKAQLVTKAEEWIYSSAKDYAGLRKGTLCNQVFTKELGIIP